MRVSRLSASTQLQEVHLITGWHYQISVKFSLSISKPDERGRIEIGRSVFTSHRFPCQVVGVANDFVSAIIDQQRCIEATLDVVSASPTIASTIKTLCDGHIALLQIGTRSQIGHVIIDIGLRVANRVSRSCPNPTTINSPLFGRNSWSIDSRFLRVKFRSIRLAFGQNIMAQNKAKQKSQMSNQ